MEGIASRLDPDIKIAPLAAQVFAQMNLEDQFQVMGLKSTSSATANLKRSISRRGGAGAPSRSEDEM